MINQNFIYLGFILNLIGGGSYVLDTLKGKTQPNRITWFLWTLTTFIAGCAAVAQGVGLQALLSFGVGLPPLLIFLASFVNKKSYWKLQKRDYICGGLSLLGLLLWYITKIGNIAIIFSIVSDLFAGIPTIIKSYTYPETENYIEFLFAGVFSVITVLTITHWNFATWGFPIYMIFFNFSVYALIKFKLGKRAR